MGSSVSPWHWPINKKTQSLIRKKKAASLFGISNQRKSHTGFAAFPLSHCSLAQYSSTHPSLQSAQELPLKRYFYRDHLPLDRPLFVLLVQPQGNNKITGFLPYFWVPPVLWRYGVSVFWVPAESLPATSLVALQLWKYRAGSHAGYLLIYFRTWLMNYA